MPVKSGSGSASTSSKALVLVLAIGLSPAASFDRTNQMPRLRLELLGFITQTGVLDPSPRRATSHAARSAEAQTCVACSQKCAWPNVSRIRLKLAHNSCLSVSTLTPGNLLTL